MDTFFCPIGVRIVEVPLYITLVGGHCTIKERLHFLPSHKATKKCAINELSSLQISAHLTKEIPYYATRNRKGAHTELQAITWLAVL